MEEIALRSRLKHAWNGFTNRDPTSRYQVSVGGGYSSRPDRARFSRGNERSIVTSVYNRIALDVAAIDIKHTRLDEDGRYVEDMTSGLNNCLTLNANIDQSGREFIQDVVISMFDEGRIAIVPIDTSVDLMKTDSYDIISLRVGKILDWYPSDIRIEVYNDQNGRRETLIMPKSKVAIIENPLYAVINEPNSTMQRLIRTLNRLDEVDEQCSSGRLDLLIELPYSIKTDARRAQAEKRRKDIEIQLTDSKYGIAYIDGTEHVTQLNRPVDNQLMSRVEYLTNMVFSQIGMTQSILDGTADEQTMLNYYNRSIEPIVAAITGNMKWKFLTQTARTQGQSISAFRDPFKMVPLSNIAEIADKLTRNEIFAPNEIRQKIGTKPSNDPNADELRNRNISAAKTESEVVPMRNESNITKEEIQNEH